MIFEFLQAKTTIFGLLYLLREYLIYQLLLKNYLQDSKDDERLAALNLIITIITRLVALSFALTDEDCESLANFNISPANRSKC